jgi:hypothetical protein
LWNALWFGTFSFMELLHLLFFRCFSYILKHLSTTLTLNFSQYRMGKPFWCLIFGALDLNSLDWIMFVQSQLASEYFRHKRKTFTLPLILLTFSNFTHFADFYTFLQCFSGEFPKLHFSRCKNSNSIRSRSLQTLFFKVQQLQGPLSNKSFSNHFRSKKFRLLLPDME